MITSVAANEYLSYMVSLMIKQGFNPDMHIIYDSEHETLDDWLTDDLADKDMPRKRESNKDNIRSGPYMALYWTRSSLEPIIRRPYRLIDRPDPGMAGPAGKSTVNAKFRIACAYVSNKAEAVEDLEEAFAAVFQSTYNVPLSLEYIYNSATEQPDKAGINFTFIQNMGEADLVDYKEGNLFAYAWSADIYMNCVSEFAWSKVHPLRKVAVDLYAPGGIPISSLDTGGKGHWKVHTAVDGTQKTVPARALVETSYGPEPEDAIITENREAVVSEQDAIIITG